MRQCLQRADAIADATLKVRDNATFEELHALFLNQRELIEHLCVNLKGGYAVPPTPQHTRALKSSTTPPVTHARGAYYNENDPFAAQWLRNLIAAGHIAPGDVERSIVDVQPDDLRAYGQCHFFAGIGGWSCALRLAGWPDDRPVWTGSCPCQPFSAAGAQRGSDDERHLWPAFFDLIRECSPRAMFGEQVAGAAGAAWWDHVAADLESAGYAAAAANLGAHSIGAPHIRQRLYWVAHSHQQGRGEQRFAQLLDSKRSAQRNDADGRSALSLLADDEGHGWRQRPSMEQERAGLADYCTHGWMGFAEGSGSQERERSRALGEVPPSGSQQASPWGRCDWIKCSDGKSRPVEPGTFPLAHGVRNRVGRLRAYGNAIVPQVAAGFVMANVRHERP